MGSNFIGKSIGYPNPTARDIRDEAGVTKTTETDTSFKVE
ncbi:MAG: hypothetical protein CM15mP48_1610 [Candidatus Poseidoniales archaeon]|nr:MAG: hypothetical protein CM15mP48_1610 [Candidatus Poseidoniales archaeon]